MKGAICSGMLDVVELGRIEYVKALAVQEKLLSLRQDGKCADILLLLEHPPVFTLGRNAKVSNILISRAEAAELGIEVVRTSRGGDVTYHGPGQLVGYPIIRLVERGLSVVGYVDAIEKALAATLRDLGIETQPDARHRGVWVGLEKIAAIGVRISKGVTMHGFALNVCVDLTPYRYIVPCGISDRGVTSLHILMRDVDPDRVREVLLRHFVGVFGYENWRAIKLPE